MSRTFRLYAALTLSFMTFVVPLFVMYGGLISARVRIGVPNGIADTRPYVLVSLFASLSFIPDIENGLQETEALTSQKVYTMRRSWSEPFGLDQRGASN